MFSSLIQVMLSGVFLLNGATFSMRFAEENSNPSRSFVQVGPEAAVADSGEIRQDRPTPAPERHHHLRTMLEDHYSYIATIYECTVSLFVSESKTLLKPSVIVALQSKMPPTDRAPPEMKLHNPVPTAKQATGFIPVTSKNSERSAQETHPETTDRWWSDVSNRTSEILTGRTVSKRVEQAFYTGEENHEEL